MIVVTSWDCDGLGLIVLVAKITKNVFVGLEFVGYVVYNFVVLGYVKAFNVWVGASEE